ncbi:related to polymerase I core factor (CF) subunit [Phialocephala subalpina]|uniref:Related to polymerase I core factor (CF) subunit n=1 Tax=Phialocephala subalpina TaxID=576137 RepID=A0A1L7XBF4_9HELO|nr:related to polymerase I core factor (CF) subunit [Phialocephala subalpina]
MSQHIEYQKFRRGESCTEEGCRARKFYIEDGKKFCQRGHEQFGFTQTQQDEDDWNAQGKKSRRKREEKERVETVLSGSEARELYLQCYQLILWKQCHWLVNVKGFPKELETVVRDLWGLRVSVVQKREDSSTSEGENDTDGTRGSKSLASSRSRRSAANGEERLPKLVETMGLCYLGMVLMRLNTSLGEVYKWATRDEIITEIPKEMRVKLPGHFHSALEMKSVLKGSTLYRTVQELLDFYSIHYEMICPNLNAPLLLFKHIRDLGLPVEICPAVRRLAELLGIDFSWPPTNKRAKSLSAYPEIQMISLIVIATKLSHPFDDIPRIPESDSEPTTVRIDWPKWVRTMAELPARGLKRGEEIRATDADVANMNARKMDDYLDWYQRTWIDDSNPKMPEQVLELFPLEKLPPRPVEEDDLAAKVARLKLNQNDLVVQKAKPSEGRNINRPGELYKRYRTVEELPSTARAFYELAASNAGISLRTLVNGVFRHELKVESWIVAERKKAMAVNEDV